MSHLWEINHPYYGAEGTVSEFDSIDELIEHANSYDADINHVYRWDWLVPDAQCDGPDAPHLLVLFVVLPRKVKFLQWQAPVTEADEDKVREFLASARVLGALRKMWEPIL